MLKAYEIEGYWTGYPAKDFLVHREYTRNKKYAEMLGLLELVPLPDSTFIIVKINDLGILPKRHKKKYKMFSRYIKTYIKRLIITRKYVESTKCIEGSKK